MVTMKCTTLAALIAIVSAESGFTCASNSNWSSQDILIDDMLEDADTCGIAGTTVAASYYNRAYDYCIVAITQDAKLKECTIWKAETGKATDIRRPKKRTHQKDYSAWAWRAGE